MLVRVNFLALALLLAQAWETTATSPLAEFKVKESINVPHGWTRLREAPADHEISLRIGLPQPNFPTLERHLYEVSDPDHVRYGAHLSKEEVEALVAPHPASLDAINAWLRIHGFEETDIARSPAQDWVTIKVPVKLAEEMLGTTYHVWRHDRSGEQLVRATSYSLPADLHEHVDVIQPTTIFARWSPMKSTLHWPDAEETVSFVQNVAAKVAATPGVVDPTCNATVTLSCLQQLYRTVGYIPQAADKNAIGITGYLEQFANEQDLRSFYTEQLPVAVNSTFEFVSVKGGLNNQTLEEAGAEANLDVQFAFGLAYPTPGTFWSTAGRPPYIPHPTTPTNTNEPYADWLDFVLAQRSPPQSISTSYGEPEQTVPEAYARRVCQQLAQLSVRGVSLMFSSGDGGVGDGDPSPETQECIVNGDHGLNVTRFLPTFPSTCPYVTSVGGTNFIPETAVYFSGGGFSEYFSRPYYQERAVQGFFKTIPKDLYKGLYNRKGRGYPDVAALGRRFRIWYRGRPVSIGGTSASSPAVAGIVALLNDARLAKGLPPLGFLNPLLYSRGVAGFNDITEGNNPGCGTPGFNATKGWDPITGLGTPDFVKLKDIVA